MLLTILLQIDIDFIADQATDVYYALQIAFQALAGIFGFVGALRIYNQWQLHGRHLHVDKQIAGWVGASLFFLFCDEFISHVLL